MEIATVVFLLLALFLGVCWWLQARRDWRLLRERTRLLTCFVTFDGKDFHAKGPPRQPKEATGEQDNLSDD